MAHTRRKCDLPVRRLGYGQDEAGGWYVEFGVDDGVGTERKRTFSMAELAVDTGPLLRFLGGAGFIPSSDQRQAVKRQVLGRPDKPTFWVPTMQGWHGKAFVTPHRVYGRDCQDARTVRSDLVDAKKWAPAGELKAWRTQIDWICAGNPLLTFAVSVAFAPPLLPLFHLPTVGFSFVGKPNLGKSTALALAGSVWGGNPDKRLGYCETFLKTANAFDKVGRRYRDCLLCLDEAHLADRFPRDAAATVGAVVHRLASGETKETAIDDALPTYGTLVYLMSSNALLRDMFDAAGLPFDGSYEMRLIEILVEGPQGMFARVPEGMTAREFTEDIIGGIPANYGTPIDRYLTRLTKARNRDEGALTEWLAARMRYMARRLKIDGNDGTEARRGQFFCLTYAAAYLAKEYGVVPWSRKTIEEGVEVAYTAHRQLGTRVEEERDLIGEAARFIQADRAKFIDVRDHRRKLKDSEFNSAPGFIMQTRRGARYFAFAPAAFEGMFRTEDDALQALRLLKGAGLLKHDKGKLTTKASIRINRDRDRVYAVRVGILAPGNQP